MEIASNCITEKLSRQWRTLVKKQRRKRMRQRAAKERQKKLDEEFQSKLQDHAYQQWLQQQNELEELQRDAEERQRQYMEEQWLRRDLIAQQHFQLERQKQLAAEEEQKSEQLRREKELAAELELKRKIREDQQRREEESRAEFERLMRRMEEFLEDPDMEPLPELKRITETRPGRDTCQIFERTNCCRYGLLCIHNHRRPMLSRILVIRHFFTHPRLELYDNEEYNNDALLEYSDVDIQIAYVQFFEDVIAELEKFGDIINFRTVCNIQSYLRGHVFIEYSTERAALKAFINLQGRYYAKRRLNVEFSNILFWRTAICGLSFVRKCPQGRNCLYLHLFSNPGNKYNTPLEITKKSSNRQAPSVRLTTPLLTWNDLDNKTNYNKNMNGDRSNWRWSESPESELKCTDTKIEKFKINTEETTKTICSNHTTPIHLEEDENEKCTSKYSHKRNTTEEYDKNSKQRTSRCETNGKHRGNSYSRHRSQDRKRRSRDSIHKKARTPDRGEERVRTSRHIHDKEQKHRSCDAKKVVKNKKLEHRRK